MKHHIITRIAALLVFSLIFTTSLTLSAQNTQTDAITGTWVFDDTQSFPSILPAIQQQMDSIPQFRSNIESAYVGRHLYFESNGNYAFELADGRRSEGTWVLTQNNTIEITDAQGMVARYTISSVDQNRMVLLPIKEGSFESLISQWHLIKL